MRKIPPKLATSSPYKMTVGSRRISSTNASLIPCAYVIVRIAFLSRVTPRPKESRRLVGSGKHVFQRGLGLRKRLLLHELDRAIDPGARVGLGLGAQRVVEDAFLGQLGLVDRDGIAPPLLFDFLARAITLRVPDPVAPEAVSLGLDQGRARSGAGALQRLTDRGEDLLRIVTIHDLSRNRIT